MAELTRAQLEAARDRADALTLSPGEVALQTSDTMPEFISGDEDAPLGTELETAGSEQHGAIRSYTRADVVDALAQWDAHDKRSAAATKAAETRQDAAGSTGGSRSTGGRAASGSGRETRAGDASRDASRSGGK